MPVSIGRNSVRLGGRSNDSDTGRIVFPRSVKHQLFMAQKGRCSYCGRTHRTRYLEIDHKHPVSRGGGNEIGNLQLLCTPCNMRKGIQTDEEFRHRYRRLLPADDSVPHHPIPQDEFTAETQRTRASREVRGIYHERFSAYRRSQDGGFGFLLATAALVIIVATVLTQTC